MNETDLLLVNRNGRDYALPATKLEDLTDDADLLVVNRNGVDYKVTAQDLKEYINPTPVMPWESYKGVLMHIKNATADVDLGWEFMSVWNAETKEQREGTTNTLKAGENLVIATTPWQNNYISSAGNFEFGEYTDLSRMTVSIKISSPNFNSSMKHVNYTSECTNMSSAFSQCTAFNQDLSHWDTSNVTDMRSMFQEASDFNQDLSGWCVSKIASEPSNFATGVTGWTLPKPCWGHCPPQGDPCPLLTWEEYLRDEYGGVGAIYHIESTNARKDTPYVVLGQHGQTFMSWKPDGTDQREIDRVNTGDPRVVVTPSSKDFFERNANSDWKFLEYTDVSNEVNMESMFVGCRNFNDDISDWDVSNVTNMDYMFDNATAFNQDLSQWCVSKITNEPEGFANYATAWTEPKPVWGTCPRGEDQ